MYKDGRNDVSTEKDTVLAMARRYEEGDGRGGEGRREGGPLSSSEL